MRKLFKNTLFVFLKELMPLQRQDTSLGGACSRGAPLEQRGGAAPGRPEGGGRPLLHRQEPSSTEGQRRPLPGPGQGSEAGALASHTGIFLVW